jgi:putative endonuclease
MRNYERGRMGEKVAKEYLERKGYVILESNYRSGKEEIDIVCEKEGVVVFVEVKRRGSDEYGSPYEAIDEKKVESIMRVAEGYLKERELLGKCEIRFDVIGIGGGRIEHIEGAFK